MCARFPTRSISPTCKRPSRGCASESGIRKFSVHGLIATVWAPYDFWIDGKLSHCGIDAFDLIKTEDGWKIAGGVYTVESNCAPSPLGPLKQE